MCKLSDLVKMSGQIYVTDKPTQCKCVYFKEGPDLVQEDE